ncbi:MAG TPA: HAD hydrolase-like protein [Micromonosporaceae bacterium]|jgi:phosphoglycolate phosphatase-like HAD superfamily hydrolase|nr:HAD hydrolase-like protein [Micromonosporaceae bacterium]
MHLVWDWNGTLLNDLDLVVSATNEAFVRAGGAPISADEHRRRFRRPIAEFYGEMLGRELTGDGFAELDEVFHACYNAGLPACALVDDAVGALRAWPDTQSLLSMWFHDELVPAVDRHGLTRHFARVDGQRVRPGGGLIFKAELLAGHLAALGVPGEAAVLIGDSVDDADAAAAVGAACVLYSGGFTDAERLRAAGRPVAGTLLEAVALAEAAVAGLPA